MSKRADNSFIDSLARQCSLNVPDEKILIAPTRRIGRQWLAQVSRAGTPVVNVRIETLASLAMTFTAAEFPQNSARLMQDAIGPLFVESLLEGNSTDWPDSPGLCETLYKTLCDLRNGCVTLGDVQRAGFETSQRGTRLVHMLGLYAEKLRENGYFDPAELFTSSAAAIAKNGLRTDAVLICSAAEQTFWTAAQWAFWRAIPQEKKITVAGRVALQQPEARPVEQTTSLRQRFAVALENKTGHVNFFRAIGHAAEVREIFRRCLTEKIPLDEVEILYTDKSTYLPLLCEECSAVFGAFDAATFIQGIPAMYSRPGRLVMEWCDWVASNFSQEAFSRILCDGLLTTKKPSTVLAEKLASLPVGFNRQRWLDVPATSASLHPDDAVLEELRDIAAQHAALAEGLDAKAIKPETLLRSAAQLVTKHSRCADALDNLAKQRITAFIADFTSWYDSHPSQRETLTSGWLEWLKTSVGAMTVGAMGPMSGRIHVGPLRGGGHAGRKHVFIVGMNDAFFPGRGRPDPLLLDGERQSIFEFTHKLLPLSWHAQHESIERLVAMIAETQGRLTLSYCSHDMIDDREMYPATILLTLAAVLQNAASFSLEELDSLAGQPVAFLPGEASHAVDAVRSILTAYGDDAEKMQQLCRAAYANIEHGYAAADAWQHDDVFTQYDGNVTPDAGDEKPLFSPSGLEMLAACPRKFMFAYRLKIKPPDEISPEAETWLDAAQFGTLMHDSFCEFYRRRAASGDFNVADETTKNELVNILEANIRKFESEVPIPGDNALRTTRRQALEAVNIFLREEAAYLKENDYRPLYMEAAVGLPPEQIGETCGTQLDREDPMEIPTTGGSMFVRGRIDRIDCDAAGRRYAIWDYKTGSAAKYRGGKFSDGRILQHYLYSLMAGRLLSQGEIESVGYYFISHRGRGERITYKPADLREEGGKIIASLRKLVTAGAYPATASDKDCTYCDYTKICGDVKMLAARMKRMIENSADEKLAPMKALRGLEGNGEE